MAKQRSKKTAGIVAIVAGIAAAFTGYYFFIVKPKKAAAAPPADTNTPPPPAPKGNPIPGIPTTPPPPPFKTGDQLVTTTFALFVYRTKNIADRAGTVPSGRDLGGFVQYEGDWLKIMRPLGQYPDLPTLYYVPKNSTIAKK